MKMMMTTPYLLLVHNGIIYIPAAGYKKYDDYTAISACVVD